RHGVRPAETLAMGDGANDIPMLAVAGLAIGVRPKPVVAARLHHRIRHADLTAALYVQGYRREQFVARP
ncbi:MAG: HAD hydrolase family protein, partial [Alphaproteobacteria bacterium]